MEQAIKILIYIHSFFGGLGLITGTISVLVKKGGKNHKISGKIFTISMMISALISLFVARMPNHENMFLFLIGIFTIYLVLSGNRALTFKSKTKLKADNIDKSISGIMFLTSVGMTAIGIYGLLQKIDNSILFLFFGGFGLSLTLKDFKTFKTFSENKNAWIKSHIARMVGALIASFTAFIVAGLSIGNIFAWIMPTIVGTIYIVYWSRKFKSTNKDKN